MRSLTNVLITGGAGFIGSNFIRTLLKKDSTFTGRIINLDALTYCINNRYIEDSAVEGSKAQVIMEVVEDVESIERVLSYR